MPVPLASIPATGEGSFTYRWFASSDGTTFTEIAGAIYETYSPAAPAGDTWFKREVTSTLNGTSCIDETNTVRVTVLNFSPGSISGDVTICAGDTPAVFGSTAPSGDAPSYTYQWRQSNDGFNFLDIPGATSETYVTGPLAMDTWYKRVVYASMNGTTCPAETNVVKVTVNNLNAGTIISDQTICSGSDPIPFFSIVHGTADGTMTYQWQISPDGLIFSDIPGTDAAVYDSPALTADTWFRRVVRSTLDAVECSGVSNVVKVTVNSVSGGTISDNETICFGATPPPFTSPDDGSGTGIVTYQWQRSNDSIIFSVIPGANNTDYTPGAHYTDTWYKRTIISIRNGILCTAESNVIKVTVNPLPIAILSGGAIICPGESAVLKVEFLAGTGPFELDIENHGVVSGYISNADIQVTPATTTSYRLLRVRDVNGCEIISPHANLIGNATIVVRDLPAITAHPSDRVICEYGATAFTVTATGSELTYQWYVNKGSGFEALTEGGVYFGTAAATLNIFGGTRDLNGYVYNAVVTGCGTSVTSGDALLTVNTPPVIEVQPVESIICLNDNTSFTVVASGTGLTYQWQVNSGSGFSNVTDGGVYSGATSSTLNLTGVPAGFNNHMYRVVVSGTCPSPAYSNFVTLRVNLPPVVTLHPAGKSVCDASGTVYFTANGSGMIDSLRWQVNNSGTWTDIYDNGVYSGTRTQQLSFINPPVSLNGNEYRLALKAYCAVVYSNSAILTVNTNPVVSFPADPINACGGVAETIVPVIAGGSGTWTQHSWSGDIGPLSRYDIQSPVFQTLIPGTYGLDYRVVDTNGCFGTGSVDVIVDSPDANFVQDRPNGCTPLSVQFTKDMTGIDHWEWDFGDGSPVNTTDADPVHDYTNSTPASILYNTVTLRVWSAGGCVATKTSLVTVYPAIDATFSADRIVVCHGESITFTGLNGANTYLWNYGDGTSGPGTNVTSHLYTNTDSVAIIRTVTLTTSSYYSCSDIETMDITVLPRPAPQFTATPVIQTYSPAGNIVSFANETNPGVWNWSWEFGDGGTDVVKNPSHTYTDMGTFTVTLSVTNGTCSEKVQHQINIIPLPPVADFDSIHSGCEPLLIDINNTSENTTLSGTTYRWDFGDGGTSVAKNPEYTYHDPGIYRIELTVTGPGGTSVRSQIVHVYPTPMASFDVAPRLVFVNDKLVRAFNLSTGADYYVWDWGDGDTSRTKEPTHKYMEEGIYDITLSAYKDNGNGNICYDQFVLSPGVTVEPVGELRFATVFRPNLTGPIERTDLPVGGEEVDQFFFPPIREKVINYKLQVFNRLGVLIFETHDINIPWNGYYNNQLCPQGVYVWYVEGKFTNGSPFKKAGDVTLLH
jgi:PKD repeat protein